MRIFYQSPVARNWIRQRPHEISEGLASLGHQVFWFYSGSFHKTRFRQFNDGNGFSGLELPVLPFASRCRLIEWVNRLWASWWLRRVAADVTVLTHPLAVPLLPEALVGGRVVYDCMDVQTAFFTGCLRRRMQETEQMVVNAASRIVVTSSVIRDKLVSEYEVDAARIRVVTNGVTMAQDKDESPPVAVEHPSIAYFGTIAAWFDWESVLAAAKAHPDWSIDLFGPVDKPIAPLPRNVHLRGPIPHARVLSQARSCDILIMPFVRNELIEGVDPVKMYEYLSVGRPIVSSWWPLLEKFKAFPAVSFYFKAGEFAARIHEALGQTARHSVPVEFLETHSWAHRVADFEQVLKGTRPDD